MTNYNYPAELADELDAVIKLYPPLLSKVARNKEVSLELCEEAIEDYFSGFDDAESETDLYADENAAEDLYNYIQSKQHLSALVDHDIYTITPKLEADLSHVLNILDVLIEEQGRERDEIDPRLVEAYRTMLALPFFAK